LIDAIEAIFPPQWFSQFPSHGNAKWTAQKVFWMSIVMGWQPKATLEERFEFARDVLRQAFPRWSLGKGVSGFLEARRRLLEEMRLPMLLWLQKAVSVHFESWRVRGWMLFGVDGSRFETCRTTANEKGLGCAGKESTTPQVFQTTLMHIGTGLPWNYRLGPGTQSERRQLDDMLNSLPPQSMLTADAGFISFNLCRWLGEQGHRFVLRVGSNVRLLTGLDWRAERRGNLVYLWPISFRATSPIVLRLVVVKDEDHQPVYLVTNVLGEELLSDSDAAEIYRLRWDLELYYRTFKQTLDHKTLHSRTPQMTLTEQTWNVLATWLLQLITVQELIAAGEAPASWSAAKARKAARTLLRRTLTGQRCNPSCTFRRVLRAATIDDYRRTRPKQIREWPRKKKDKPPGPPKLQAATDEEKQLAKRLGTTAPTKS